MQITQREEPDVEIKLTPEEVRSALSVAADGSIVTARNLPPVYWMLDLWDRPTLESFLNDKTVSFEVAGEIARSRCFGVCGTGGRFTVYLATNPDALASLMGRKSH